MIALIIEKHIIDLIMLGQYNETIEFIEQLFQYALKNIQLNRLRIFMVELNKHFTESQHQNRYQASLNYPNLYDAVFRMDNISDCMR